MSDQLVFDDQTASHLEQLYMSADVRKRRALATSALTPRPGERLLDVGCGPGFHAAELAEAVGESGLVIGIDTSETMLAVATDRNAGRANVEFRVGDAVGLPIADASVDGVVAVQVYEYVADVAAALAEAFRVLKPGGRLVVVDVDWSTVSWYSNKPDRMQKMLSVWDQHLAHRALPQRLAHDLTSGGFIDVETHGHAFVNTDNSLDGYSGAVIPLIADFATANNVSAKEAVSWSNELQELSRNGEYFFTITKFVFDARRPA